LKEIKEKNIKVFTFESLTKDQNIFFCELYFFLELTPNLSYKNFSEINNVCGDLQINTKINQRKNINENKNKNISSFKKKIYLNYIKNKNIEYLIGDEYLLDIKNRKTEKTKKIELFRYYFSGLKLPFKIFKNHLYWRLKK
jgi:hypothetical protein